MKKYYSTGSELLAIIVNTLVSRLDKVQSIVLTGSMVDAPLLLPQNDVDLILIYKKKSDYLIDWFKLRPLQKVWKELTGGYHVDIIPLFMNSSKNINPSIFNYDAQQRHQCIWGTDWLNQTSRISISDIPIIEYERLLSNRALCLLEGFPNESDLIEYSAWQTSKAIFALVDCTLAKHQKASPCYQNKVILLGQIPMYRNSRLLELAETSEKIRLQQLHKLSLNIKQFWFSTHTLYKSIFCEYFGGSDEKVFDLLKKQAQRCQPSDILKAFIKRSRILPNTAQTIVSATMYGLYDEDLQFDKDFIALIPDRFLSMGKPVNWQALRKYSIRTWYHVNH